MPSTAGRTKSARVSTREFARRVGVSQPAVVRALRTGRLLESVRRDAAGKPRIVDAALAEREWRERASARSGGGKETRRRARPKTKADADLLVTIERERKLRLENDVREGRLIEATRAKRDGYETARTVRDGLLNIPDRLAAELAAESDAARVHARLDEEIRLALVALAEAISAESTGGGGDGHGAAS